MGGGRARGAWWDAGSQARTQALHAPGRRPAAAHSSPRQPAAALRQRSGRAATDAGSLPQATHGWPAPHMEPSVSSRGGGMHAPRGPSVTCTASATLLMPSCILRRDALSKMMSLASARTTCGSGRRGGRFGGSARRRRRGRGRQAAAAVAAARRAAQLHMLRRGDWEADGAREPGRRCTAPLHAPHGGLLDAGGSPGGSRAGRAGPSCRPQGRCWSAWQPAEGKWAALSARTREQAHVGHPLRLPLRAPAWCHHRVDDARVRKAGSGD